MECHPVVTLLDVSKLAISREEFQHHLSFVWEDEARSRILRYHKGCASPADFTPHQHLDTRCFLYGRLLLQSMALAHVDAPPTADRSTIDLQESSSRIGNFRLCKSVFRRTSEGKPHFDNEQGWSGNVAHAGCLVGCSSARGWLNGLDVMPVELVPVPTSFTARECDSRELWESALTVTELDEFLCYFTSYFTDVEWAWIRGVTGETAHSAFETLKRFYRNWTLKESYIKAIGIGLGLDLQRAEFRIPDDAIHVCSPSTDSNGCGVAASSVRMYLDGELREEWLFYCFDFPHVNSVGAVAFGPLVEAVSPLFPSPTSIPQYRRPGSVTVKFVLLDHILDLYVPPHETSGKSSVK